MQRLDFLFLILILASLLVGCTGSGQIQPTSTNAQLVSAKIQPTATKSLEDDQPKIGAPTVASLTESAQMKAILSIPPADCPITIAENDSFRAPEPFSPIAPWESMFWYGSEGLWTALHKNGVWNGLPHNPGGYTQKIMWWSDSFVLKDELIPALVVTGRRLDAESEPLKFDGATNAMAEDIGEAMLTGVDFPSLGCWEITGQYKKTGLTFVVWVAP
jgi:hypothetical protein